MKRLILIFLLCFCFVQAQAKTVTVVVGGVPSDSSPACGATLLLGTEATMSGDTPLDSGYWEAVRFAALANGTAGCFKVNVQDCGSATTEDFGVALYSNAAGGAGDDDDRPDTVLAYAENGSWSCATGYQTFTFNTSVSLTAGTLYWIAVFGTSNQIRFKYDADGDPANTEFRYGSSGQVYNTRPAGTDYTGSFSDRIFQFVCY